MYFQSPPHGGLFKLVATKQNNEDIILMVLIETNNGPIREEIRWKDVPHLDDEALKIYLFSLREGIEKGMYDVKLLEAELNLHSK